MPISEAEGSNFSIDAVRDSMNGSHHVSEDGVESTPAEVAVVLALSELPCVGGGREMLVSSRIDGAALPVVICGTGTESESAVVENTELSS